MICTVTLNPAVDYVLRLGELHPGEINRANQENLLFGGKGINVSTVLRRLGDDTFATGFLAGFTGNAIRAELEKEGIPCDFVQLQEGFSRINVKLKAGKEKIREETEINGQGPKIPPEALEELIKKLERLSRRDILVLAGSVPPSLPKNVYTVILARLSGKGIRFVVDTEKDSLLDTLPYEPFLIKPNQRELEAIFGRELSDPCQIFACARELQKKGARNVLVSRGENGALLLDEWGCTHEMGALPGKLVNSVGAGDAMVAGFLSGYVHSENYCFALKTATACGAATAFSVGLAEKDTILELMQQL